MLARGRRAGPTEGWLGRPARGELTRESTEPIPGVAFCVRDCDDVDVPVELHEHHGVREVVHERPAHRDGRASCRDRYVRFG